ncbi:hypothetical protein GCM10010273_55860 [Streptomyces lavendulocolor]
MAARGRKATQAQEERLAAARPRDDRQYAIMDQGYADAMANIPYDTAATPIFEAPPTDHEATRLRPPHAKPPACEQLGGTR